MDSKFRRRTPTLAAIYRYTRSSTTPFCRITGKSHSMDEHHYVPNSDDYPKFDRISGCRITEKHGHFKDYKYVYPILDLDGTTRMVTEHDFHCRITAKYRAMSGHKYLYPVLNASTDKTVDDMSSVVEDESMRDVIVPSEVELIVRGGIKDVLKLNDSDYLFIYSKEGAIVPAALREIPAKRLGEDSKHSRRHTLPAGLEAGLAFDLEKFRQTTPIKMLSEIKLPETIENSPVQEFDLIREEVEVLPDVRKTRPKRPGKRNPRGNEIFKAKRIKVEDDSSADKENLNNIQNKPDSTETLSRLERYKLKFSNFEVSDNKETGNRLIPVGAFDENDVEELDFSEPMKIEYTSKENVLPQCTPKVDFIEGKQCVASVSYRNIMSSNNGNVDFYATEFVTSEASEESYLSNAQSLHTGNDNGLIRLDEARSTCAGNSLNIYSTESDKQEVLSNFKNKECLKSWESMENLDSFPNTKALEIPVSDIKEKKGTPAFGFGGVLSELKGKLGKMKSSKISEENSENVRPVNSQTEPVVNELKSRLDKMKHSKFPEENPEDIKLVHPQIESVVSDKCLQPGGVFSESVCNGLSEKIALTKEMQSLEEKTVPFEQLKHTSLNSVDQINSAEDQGKLIKTYDILNHNENIIGSEITSFTSVTVKQDTLKETENYKCKFEENVKEFNVSDANIETITKDTSSCSDFTNAGVHVPLSEKYSTENNIDMEDSAFQRSAQESDVSLKHILMSEETSTSNKLSGPLSLTSTLNESNGNITFSEMSISNFDENEFNEKVGLKQTKQCLEDTSNYLKSNILNVENDIENNVSQTFFSHETNHDTKNQNSNNCLAINKTVQKEMQFVKQTNSSINKLKPGNNSANNDINNIINENNILQTISSHKINNDSISVESSDFQTSVTSFEALDECTGVTKASNVFETLRKRLPVTHELLNKEISDVLNRRGKNVAFTLTAQESLEEKQTITTSIANCEQGIDVYVAIMDFKPMGSDEEAVVMKEGQQVEVIDASKPRRWLVRTVPMGIDESPREGWVPACYLEKSTARDTLGSYVVTEAEFDPKEMEAIKNREAIVKELVETEEDFAKDMQFVVENYYKQMDNPRLPKEFRDRKGSVFGNFKDISDFHNNVLMNGVNHHAKEPTKLGKTFLRLERDFDMHASYCWNEARAQKLLREGSLRDFFDDHSRMIDDDKLLVDHLKLPIQRLNDYQLLLKELIKYSSRLNEDTADLQKALDFIHSINKRSRDLQYIQAIEGCHGDLLKLGRILLHDSFDVFEGAETSSVDRCVFLFKGRVFITEKHSTLEKESYHVTNLFKLQDVEMVENVETDALKILFKSHKKNRSGFPLTLKARSIEQKVAWCKELNSANQAVEDLGELEPSLEPVPIAPTVEEIISKSNSDLAQIEPDTPVKRQDSDKKPSATPDSSVPQTPTETENTRPSLKRQASVKKPRKSSDSSAPQTPTDSETAQPSFKKQDSVKKQKKSDDSPAPGTPIENLDKPPRFLRQDSKKSKSSDTSEPQTPSEDLPSAPTLTRQSSKKSSAPQTPSEEHQSAPSLVRQSSKKSQESTPQTPVEELPSTPSLGRQDSKTSKSSEISEPQTPVETFTSPPSLSRQESRKSKSSAPQTPVDELPSAPSLTRQDSKKSKASDASAPQTPSEDLPPPSLTRQDSKKSKTSDTSAPQTPAEDLPSLSLKRQDSQKSKVSDKSAPQTPAEELPSPSLIRQDSKRSKASDTSAPQTPAEDLPPPSLIRQDSKKSKSSDKSAPQTPAEDLPSPSLTRQDSKKSKASELSAPQTPAEDLPSPSFIRQDSKKSKASDLSAPQTPAEDLTSAPSLTRQDSKKKTEEVEKPPLARQESLSKKSSASDKRKADIESAEETEAKSKLRRQDSVKKKESKASTESIDKKKSKGEFDPMEKPRFSKPLKGITCILGETAVLECETDGSPIPSVTWLRDNQKIAKSKRIETSSTGQKHTLIIKDVSGEDGGLYTVVASSEKGSASCSAPLNLKVSLLGLPKEDSRPTTPGGTILPHAPVFKVKLNKETQLLEGTSVRFEIVVRANPEPEVKILKDGKKLKFDDRVRVSYESKEVFELILDHVIPSDAGTYTVIATNIEGEDKSVGNLSVVKHKDVFKGLEDVLEQGREPTPRPLTPKFRWFKDGQFFEANERFQVIFNEEQDSLALMFQHVTPEDAGLYTCVASTSTGSKIACSAELTVQEIDQTSGSDYEKPGVVRQVEAPSIKAELTDAEATEGGSAMLELKITGFPKPKVTWYHGGKEVSTGGRIRFLFADDETFTLVIKNVKKDDGGKYSVKAANEMGEAESSCTLTVKSAPSFIKGLKDKSIMAEELLKFEVQVDGNPTPEVKWYKDGQAVGKSDRIKIVSDGAKQSLQISNATPLDSGSYSCVITNNLGNQAEFSNVVVKASPTFIKGMSNVEGLEGDTLQFKIEINGNPKPTLKWLKDGKELAIDGKRIKVTDEGNNVYTLTIDNATLAVVGAYTCELRNEHGLKASTGNLNIKTKPEFIKKLSDLEVNDGETGLVMNVSLKGYPTPSVKWLLEDSDLKENKNCIISSEKDGMSHSLKLKKVNKSSAGKYTCEASNEMGKSSTSGSLTVKVTTRKPEMEQELKPTQLVEGKPGKLVAKVTGEPKPKITWLKDGKPIELNGRFSMEESDDGTVALLISNVSPDDAGVYSIEAVSDAGEVRSEAPVTTIPAGKKPEFTKELEKLDVIEGQLLQLTAKVTGKPTSIKWQKDGEDLSDDGRIKITEEPDGTIALTIDKASQKDAGKYTVIASNSEGKARSAALTQVLVMKKPEILSSLNPLKIKDGETGQLSVKVVGEPKPTLRWLKDGKELIPTNRVESVEEPDGTVALVIKNARPEDAGDYSVVVQNSLGEAKSEAPVEVQYPPTFQKPLKPVNVVEGYPAKLEAKLAGSPPPEIKWFKDGEEVKPDNVHVKEIISPDGTVALLIDNCKPEDAGKYSLVAKNPLGENSSSGGLGVSDKTSDSPPSAPCFVSPIGNLTVKEGEPIRFEAIVSGNPLPDINWIVNDKPLSQSDNTLMTFDGEKAILEIKESSPDHVGTYQCKLTNPLGEASSDGSVSVQEKTAPRFIQRLSDYNGFINQPLKLSCKVIGYPEPEIEWYFNGELISPRDSRYTFTNFGDVHALNIQSCRPTDSGVFECKAKNSVGEDHTRSAVNISEKPEKGEPPMFLKRIGDNEVMEGMTAKFTACITGTPTPDVSWVKEGKPLDPSPRHKMELESTGILRLIVREVESGDYGDYSVTISNIHGSATSSAKLCPDSLDQKYITPIGDQFVDFGKFKKTGIPVPLSEKPRIVRMDDSSLTLGWKPSVPTAPRVPVTYQLEMAKHPNGDWTPYKAGLKDTLCDVRDLMPGQDYKFQVRVQNKHGISDPSPYVTAHRSKIYQQDPADFKPKDYFIDHPPLSLYAAPPKFVRKEEDTMYGVKGHPVTIEFWVYGHPEPKVTWFKGDSQIGKDKYSFMQDRNGKLCVFIDCMNDDYVGTYTCLAVNDEGEATMKIKLLIAERPVFIERLDETTAMSRRSARMQCRVTGLPYPKIKWFRDWHPLYESERVKILWEEPDKCTLFISNLITRDNALYSCQAANIAGTATSSASLNVEEAEDMFDFKTFCRPIPVRSRVKPFEDFYDIGDELGRGTQGITYHAVKRETGDSFAAKTMHGKGKLKDFMKSEMEIMNQLCHPKLVRLRDAFETKDTLTLVTDMYPSSC
nr:obscurin-like isoform X2 [Parasteatoda tepidariorum]